MDRPATPRKGPPTRIKEFRKLRGLTLQQLAHKINTSPQTVQRLETANMTVSTDWLEKIARALNVAIVDLLGGQTNQEIPFLGSVDEQGRIRRSQKDDGAAVCLDIFADVPVAARIIETIGPYEAGSLLIANRFRPQDLDNAHGADCLVGVAEGPILLRRLIRGRDQGWTLVPHANGAQVQYDQTIDWAARITMAVKYF